MWIWIFIILSTSFRCLVSACGCMHTYDADVIARVEAEGDICLDEFDQQDLTTQIVIIENRLSPSEKLLEQAAYAFDTFRYNKCLEKIKAYEREAFPPPYEYPSPEEKLPILAYKAYCNRFLKRYDSAIKYFDEMLSIMNSLERHLAPDCLFITYFERAQCYLMKGDRKEFQHQITKIIESDTAPKYDYYVKNNFKVHHQPCFHDHELKYEERIVFKEIASKLLGKELYALMEERDETPKIRTVANNDEDKEYCRRMCGRASYICAIIVGCIVQKSLAISATWALSELLLDCENCCNEGWNSKNCCKDIKQAFEQVCQQHLLDGL